MKNVLYIGNKLINKRSNVSSISVLGPLFESEGFKLEYASSYDNKVIRLLDMLWACIKKREWADVVIIDTYSTWNFVYAFLVSQLCRILKLKYIPSLNGGNLPMRLIKNPKMCQSIFNSSYKLVSPSLYLKEAFEKHGFEKVYYIPNSLELDLYQYQKKEFFNINLLWVRSFSKIYNPLLAVKILKILNEEGFNVNLCMVGPDSDGSLKEVKQLANKLGVTIKFTGKLPKKEWIALAKEYNIFINTTNFDNMPVSVIEAMSLGLPVVSTNVGGIPFLIEHGKDGLIVPPNNEEAFVFAIKQLLNYPIASQTLAFNARKKVEQFDWRVIKYKWMDVLS